MSLQFLSNLCSDKNFNPLVFWQQERIFLLLLCHTIMKYLTSDYLHRSQIQIAGTCELTLQESNQEINSRLEAFRPSELNPLLSSWLLQLNPSGENGLNSTIPFTGLNQRPFNNSPSISCSPSSQLIIHHQHKWSHFIDTHVSYHEAHCQRVSRI